MKKSVILGLCALSFLSLSQDAFATPPKRDIYSSADSAKEEEQIFSSRSSAGKSVKSKLSSQQNSAAQEKLSNKSGLDSIHSSQDENLGQIPFQPSNNNPIFEQDTVSKKLEFNGEENANDFAAEGRWHKLKAWAQEHKVPLAIAGTGMIALGSYYTWSLIKSGVVSFGAITQNMPETQGLVPFGTDVNAVTGNNFEFIGKAAVQQAQTFGASFIYAVSAFFRQQKASLINYILSFFPQRAIKPVLTPFEKYLVEEFAPQKFAHARVVEQVCLREDLAKDLLIPNFSESTFLDIFLEFSELPSLTLYNFATYVEKADGQPVPDMAFEDFKKMILNGTLDAYVTNTIKCPAALNLEEAAVELDALFTEWIENCIYVRKMGIPLFSEQSLENLSNAYRDHPYRSDIMNIFNKFKLKPNDLKYKNLGFPKGLIDQSGKIMINGFKSAQKILADLFSNILGKFNNNELIRMKEQGNRDFYESLQPKSPDPLCLSLNDPKLITYS